MYRFAEVSLKNTEKRNFPRDRRCQRLKSCLPWFFSMIQVIVVWNISMWIKSANIFVIYSPRVSRAIASLNLKGKSLFLWLCSSRSFLGKCTRISFVDSTPLRVCRNQWIHIHKVFKGIAQRGKCSLGWFFGFKLHLICNEKRELLNFMITPGDVDDWKPLEYKSFVEFIYGKLVGTCLKDLSLTAFSFS